MNFYRADLDHVLHRSPGPFGECAPTGLLHGATQQAVRFAAALVGRQVVRLVEVDRVDRLLGNERNDVDRMARFGLERYLRGAMDLLTVSFLGRYQYRPLHLFGGIGLASTLVGLVISLYLLIVKLGGDPIGQRPLLFLGILRKSSGRWPIGSPPSLTISR